MGKVVMYSSVSVDGFVADENDQPGPLFDWLTSGDVPLDESGVLNVSQASYDYIRPYWDQVGVTIAGRRVFDLTDGWDGTPPSGIDHVVVVTHRPKPEGWDTEAPFHFVDGVGAAVARAQELEGHFAVELGVVGREHEAHAALADLLEDDVATEPRPRRERFRLGWFVLGVRGPLDDRVRFGRRDVGGPRSRWVARVHRSTLGCPIAAAPHNGSRGLSYADASADSPRRR